jgi:hypothetical protein
VKTDQEEVDDRYAVAAVRRRLFDVTKKQSISPLAGYLCGVLFLKRKIEARHVGHFFSFLQLVPRDMLRSGSMAPRVQGGRHGGANLGSRRYMRLVRALGHDISALHALANDRLVVPVSQLKRLLERVPLTRGGEAFSSWCETQHPRNHR